MNDRLPVADAEGHDDDQMLASVPVLSGQALRYTLVSTAGFHCNAWRCTGNVRRAGATTSLDFIVKVSKRGYTTREARVLRRDHRRLSEALEEIVPDATFLVAGIDGATGVVVFADPVAPWFDLANPGNEAEALPLLRNTRRAADQLLRFTQQARRWLDEEGRLIDLCGVENLVLDRNQTVRFLDSFHVFLYVDMLHVVDDAGELEARIRVARERLRYLEGLARAVRR